MTLFRPQPTEVAHPDFGGLVPLGLLVADGVADKVDRLAVQLGTEVVIDDVGLRCVTRSTARRLLAERAARAERVQEQRAAAQRRLSESLDQRGPVRGKPVPAGFTGDAYAVMTEESTQ